MDTTLAEENTTQRQPLPLGYIIENTYKLISIIGIGGMACVYLALDTKLLKHVAIKVLFINNNNEKDSISRARFLQEARVMASISHPNILSARKFGEIEELGLLYFAIDAILLNDNEISSVCCTLKCSIPIKANPDEKLNINLKNLSLEKILYGNRCLDQDIVCKIAQTLISILEAIHNNKPQILHRDIKPDNLLFDNKGNIYLTDFGIAKVEKVYSTTRPDTTTPGLHPGTPSYASPEQIDGIETLTPATDYYSFGLVVYKMLTGGFPATISKSLPSEIPFSKKTKFLWNKLFNGLLEKDPSKRLINSKQVFSILSTIEKSYKRELFWSKLKFKIKKPNPKKILKNAKFVISALIILIFARFCIYKPIKEAIKYERKINEIVENTIQYYDRQIEFYRHILANTTPLPKGTNILNVTYNKNYICDDISYLDNQYDKIIFRGGTITIHPTKIPIPEIEKYIKERFTPQKLKSILRKEYNRNQIKNMHLLLPMENFRDFSSVHIKNCSIELEEQGGLINVYHHNLLKILILHCDIKLLGESATLYIAGEDFKFRNGYFKKRFIENMKTKPQGSFRIEGATTQTLEDFGCTLKELY